MPCSYSVTSEDTVDFISTYSALPEQLSAMTGIECIDFVSRQFAVLHIPMDDLESPMNFSYYTYSAIPKLYSLLDTDSMEASGILPASRIPAFGNQGQGVLIGFVDTGIDYQNPLFRKEDGSSRILGIWDQTLETGVLDPVNGFQALYGTQYSREEIDQALAAPDPLALVPSADEYGHGTFLASVAAGGEDPDQDFTGAAPKASIAMVKLKPATEYLRDFYLIREGADAYQENDIMMGVAYLLHLARRFSMPLVICLGLGTNQGSHVGKSPLGLYLDDINIYAGTAVITAAGNETGYGHHYRAVTRPEETLQTVELNVGEKDSGFSMEFWAQDVDIYRVGFISPTGEVVDPLPSSTEEENVIRFLVEQTEITVYSSIINTATGSQMIFIRFKDPMPGIWNLTVSSALNVTGAFHIWLPSRGFISDTTYFLRPDPDTLVTGPGNSQYALTVSAYDHITGGIYIHSSRGFSRSVQIKPELAAPGVNITGAGLRSGFVQRSGTSAAAAHAAGAAAILLHWGILERNDPFMNTSAIKTYLIRGAKRNPALTYPNREFGYGTLDLYQAFLRLRL
ncbi:MAG: S8 family peptidase [Alitiscatomonas sp.]